MQYTLDTGSESGIRPGWGKIRIRDPEWKSRIIFPRANRNNILGLKYLNPLMLIRIRDLFDPGSRILDGKIRIRDHVLISRIRNTAYIGKLYTSLTYTYIILYSASICIVALFFILWKVLNSALKSIPALIASFFSIRSCFAWPGLLHAASQYLLLIYCLLLCEFLHGSLQHGFTYSCVFSVLHFCMLHAAAACSMHSSCITPPHIMQMIKTSNIRADSPILKKSVPTHSCPNIYGIFLSYF